MEATHFIEQYRGQFAYKETKTTVVLPIDILSKVIADNYSMLMTIAVFKIKIKTT